MRAGWALGVLLVAGTAFGKTPDELFDQGLRQLQGGDVGGARSSFLEAFASSKQPRIALQLSIAELRSNRPLEGLRHLKEYVKDPRVSASERERAKVYLDEALARTGHVRIDVPAGTEISVDSARIGAAPLAEDVDVEADKDVDVAATLGAITKHQAIHVPAGRTVTLKFEGLVGQTAAPAGSSAQAGTNPASTTLPPPNAKDESSSARLIVPLVIAGVGVASLVGSFAFGAASNSAKSDAEAFATNGPCAVRSSTSCAQLADLQETQNSRATLSYVLLGTGIVALAAATITYLVWPKKAVPSAAFSPVMVRF